MDILNKLRQAVADFQLAAARGDAPRRDEVSAARAELLLKYGAVAAAIPEEPGIAMLAAARRIVTLYESSFDTQAPSLQQPVRSNLDEANHSLPTDQALQSGDSPLQSGDLPPYIVQLLANRDAERERAKAAASLTRSSTHDATAVKSTAAGTISSPLCILHAIPVSSCRHLHAQRPILPAVNTPAPASPVVESMHYVSDDLGTCPVYGSPYHAALETNPLSLQASLSSHSMLPLTASSPQAISEQQIRQSYLIVNADYLYGIDDLPVPDSSVNRRSSPTTVEWLDTLSGTTPVVGPKTSTRLVGQDLSSSPLCLAEACIPVACSVPLPTSQCRESPEPDSEAIQFTGLDHYSARYQTTGETVKLQPEPTAVVVLHQASECIKGERDSHRPTIARKPVTAKIPPAPQVSSAQARALKLKQLRVRNG